MKKLNKLICLLLALALCLCLAACGGSGTEYTVLLVNMTDAVLSEVNFTTESADEWGDNLLGNSPLDPGESVELNLGSFSDEEVEDGFCITAYDDDDNDLGSVFEFYIEPGDTVTVYMDPDYELAVLINEAYEPVDPMSQLDTDYSKYEGVWINAYFQYFIFDADGNWELYDSYGELQNSGWLGVDEDYDGTLSIRAFENESTSNSIEIDEDGRLSFGALGTYTRSDVVPGGGHEPSTDETRYLDTSRGDGTYVYTADDLGLVVQFANDMQLYEYTIPYGVVLYDSDYDIYVTIRNLTEDYSVSPLFNDDYLYNCTATHMQDDMYSLYGLTDVYNSAFQHIDKDGTRSACYINLYNTGENVDISVEGALMGDGGTILMCVYGPYGVEQSWVDYMWRNVSCGLLESVG